MNCSRDRVPCHVSQITLTACVYTSVCVKKLRKAELLMTLHLTATEQCHLPYRQDHTVLPATQHKSTHPALTPTRQRPVLDLPTLEEWKAELT